MSGLVVKTVWTPITQVWPLGDPDEELTIVEAAANQIHHARCWPTNLTEMNVPLGAIFRTEAQIAAREIAQAISDPRSNTEFVNALADSFQAAYTTGLGKL